MERTQTGLNVLVALNDLGVGGTQLNALDLAIAAREHGVNSTIVGYSYTLPRSGTTFLDVAQERDFPVTVIDRATTFRQRVHDLSSLAEKCETDLVHTFGANSPLHQAFWGPCRLARRPLVMTVYEQKTPTHVFRVPQLIVGTRYQLEELQTTRGNVHLISPPVDLTRDDSDVVDGSSFVVDQLSLPEDHLRVVIVSRLDDSMKAFGVRVAMGSIEQLGRADVDLIVVGQGPAGDSLRAEGDKVNARLGRRAIVYAGAMADPRPAYASADLVLGMGGSAARALAFARPLVVIGERGTAETFTPETSQALFRNSFWSDHTVDDPEQRLLSHLIPLLNDLDERHRLGAFGRQFAAANFGLTEMANRQVSVYAKAMTTYGQRQWLADGVDKSARAIPKLPYKLRRKFLANVRRVEGMPVVES